METFVIQGKRYQPTPEQWELLREAKEKATSELDALPEYQSSGYCLCVGSKIEPFEPIYFWYRARVKQIMNIADEDDLRILNT